MPITLTKAQKEFERRQVTVVNTSEHDIHEYFDGSKYTFPGKSDRAPKGSFLSINAGIATIWFGDPRVKRNETTGHLDTKAWNEEISKVRNRVHEDEFKARVDGKFYVKEWATNYRFYEAVVPPKIAVETAQPLPDGWEDDEEFRAMGLTVGRVTSEGKIEEIDPSSPYHAPDLEDTVEPEEEFTRDVDDADFAGVLASSPPASAGGKKKVKQ